MKIILFFLLLLAQWILAKEYGLTLRDVEVLTFHKGENTRGRRTDPIPQLSCKGALCSKLAPETVQCKNVGWDGNDVQWKCEAELNDIVKFGKIQVSCEGYDSAEDPQILLGSCGLEYELKETIKFEQDEDIHTDLKILPDEKIAISYHDTLKKVKHDRSKWNVEDTYNKVPLKDVEVLVFTNNKQTTGYRAAPVQQLQCSYDRSYDNWVLCAKYPPEKVQCTNVGWDGKDVVWKCEAEMEKGVSFDYIEVSCEGYKNADDPNILVGSCGLMYGLKAESYVSIEMGTKKDPGTVIFVIVVCGGLCMGIMIPWIFGTSRQSYDDDKETPKKENKTIKKTIKKEKKTIRKKEPDEDEDDNGPGFLTGMAAGYIGGKLLSNLKKKSKSSPPPPPSPPPSSSFSSSTPSYSYSSSYYSPSSSSDSSSSDSSYSSSSSSSTRTATGYGGTTRR